MKQENRRTVNLAIARLVSVVAFIASAVAGAADGCGRVDSLDRFSKTGAVPVGATCDRFIGLAGREGVSCYWVFAFRDDQAIAFSDGLWAEITQCRAGTESGPDARVNHPDSYDIRELVVGTDVYHVTIKDKGGQGRTLVFARVEQGKD